MIREKQKSLQWQSKTILLIVVPWTVASVLLQAHWWATQVPVVAWTTLGISTLFGLIVWWMKAGTPAAAATGAVITASLMFSTTRYPFEWSWLHGGLFPLLAVFLLTFAATKIGKRKKETLGTGESKRGRNAAQVAANLGVAALVAVPATLYSSDAMLRSSLTAIVAFAFLAALAEAAADTVSSEIGQVFGGQPWMITTLRRADIGADGGVSIAGTLAGVAAALIVVTIGFCAVYGGDHLLSKWISIGLATSGGMFGLLFDSLLGATLERKGWLNNDAVNFLSTLSAVALPAAIIAILVYTSAR